MSEPKYKINQTLRHVAAIDVRLFVVSVLTDTCPGGTQHHYHCRIVAHRMISEELLRINEVELREATEQELAEEAARDAFAWMTGRKNDAISEGRMEASIKWRDACDLVKSLRCQEGDLRGDTTRGNWKILEAMGRNDRHHNSHSRSDDR